MSLEPEKTGRALMAVHCPIDERRERLRELNVTLEDNYPETCPIAGHEVEGYLADNDTTVRITCPACGSAFFMPPLED
jgi:hypothetical protein